MNKRESEPKRYRAMRDDASVAAAQKAIEKEMKLPTGSVKIVLPSGRKARKDGSVGGLRDKFD